MLTCPGMKRTFPGTVLGAEVIDLGRCRSGLFRLVCLRTGGPSANTWGRAGPASPVGPGACVSQPVFSGVSGLWSIAALVLRTKFKHLFSFPPPVPSAPGLCLFLSLILGGGCLPVGGKAGISCCQLEGWRCVDLSGGLGE